MGMMYTYLTAFLSVFLSFFENGVWVLAFFYLLTRVFRNEKLIKVARGITIVMLILLLIDLILRLFTM